MRMFLFAALMAVAMLTAGQVQAQQACGPVAKVFAHLDEKYGEGAVVSFESQSGMVVAFMNRTKQTWTVVTVIAGRACVRASGKGKMVIHKTGGKGDKLPVPGQPI